MSKMFTITPGLENLGALKTGGQGSIYRARRIGPIITAVKLIPTPIASEDMADKSYRDFRNEVEKLKKVNELPNPNVVRILDSGISETGSFPFIEMEFIEGPDLEELLQPPHDPVFTIKETIRVAEHLANALAHCHRVDVKHGDIKSNNVKFNRQTGNYVLLDFGLALMSDEQRRTSLRHAGAVEFMAPEQNEGKLLFESDIYSYGIVLYELLAGRVPFPLENKNETTRNLVLVAHMETPVPDILPLRKTHIPANWPDERRSREMQVAQWLIEMIRKCLEKDPEKRFANGIELYEYILHHSTAVTESTDLNEMLQQENRKLREENKRVASEAAQWRQLAATRPAASAGKAWKILSLAGIVAAAILLALLLSARNDATVLSDQIRVKDSLLTLKARTPVSKSGKRKPVTTSKSQEPPPSQDTFPSPITQQHYLVNVARAYFHNEPDVNSRRDAYLTPSDEVMTAIDEEGDFVYIVFTNDKGQTSKGWVLKEDLRPAE